MMTRIMLESYDDELAKSRDHRQYRDKGGRRTSRYKDGIRRGGIQPESVPGHAGGWPKGICLPAGPGDADGQDRPDLHKPCRKDGHDSDTDAVPCSSRRHKQHLRSEHQCGRYMEHDAASGRKDQQRGRASGQPDECGPDGGDTGNAGAV